MNLAGVGAWMSTADNTVDGLSTRRISPLFYRSTAMDLQRRALLGTAGASAVLACMAGKSIGQEVRQQRAEQIEQNRHESKERNTRLMNQTFRIRVLNQHLWSLQFGLFGMRSNMQYRARIPGSNGRHESRQMINGGERVAVVWDDFSGGILHLTDVIIDANISFTITAQGEITW